MTAITFPASPTVGQLYVATNAVTYIWTGNQWSCMAYIVNKNSVSVKIKELKIDGKWKCNKWNAIIPKDAIAAGCQEWKGIV